MTRGLGKVYQKYQKSRTKDHDVGRTVDAGMSGSGIGYICHGAVVEDCASAAEAVSPTATP